MSIINKIRITAARDVKTIIKINLIIDVKIDENPTKLTRELHFSKDIPMLIGETLFIQDFPCKICDIYTEIKAGHVYNVGIVEFHKDAISKKSASIHIKEFAKIYNNIVKGLKGINEN